MRGWWDGLEGKGINWVSMVIWVLFIVIVMIIFSSSCSNSIKDREWNVMFFLLGFIFCDFFGLKIL